jgi:hypothetical protein
MHINRQNNITFGRASLLTTVKTAGGESPEPKEEPMNVINERLALKGILNSKDLRYNITSKGVPVFLVNDNPNHTLKQIGNDEIIITTKTADASGEKTQTIRLMRENTTDERIKKLYFAVADKLERLKESVFN